MTFAVGLHDLYQFAVKDVWEVPLTATSRTSDKLGHIDFYMFIPPLRAFFWYSVCPPLAYPIAAVHAFGYYRCIRTLKRPEAYTRDRYVNRKIYYGVQRRVYDERQQKIVEYQVDSPEEIKHALEVTNGVRNQFLDDPTHPGRAYFVVEQRVMRSEAIFTAENWGWAITSDILRFAVPAGLAFLFRQPIARLFVDLKLWRQGRLHWRQIRHPVLNFFMTYQDYRIAMRRINVTKAPKKGANGKVETPKNPWAPT
mmetsp:Transcript_26284/g.30453  ORF Transcript_26284/g.30453 Transcript_26284/m.30453 type:complete len:254 (+) Transcript_26284:85-846(+)